MKWIIDRIEDGFAVAELENKKTVNIPTEALPSELKEGDVVEVYVDKNETDKRKEKINSLAEKLFK